MIRIHISTENAAFCDLSPDQHAEVARILRELADRIQRDGIPLAGEHYQIADENGNNVGSCYFEEGI